MRRLPVHLAGQATNSSQLANAQSGADIPPTSGAGLDIFILRGGLQEHPAQPSKRYHTRASMNAFCFPQTELFVLDRGT